VYAVKENVPFSECSCAVRGPNIVRTHRPLLWVNNHAVLARSWFFVKSHTPICELTKNGPDRDSASVYGRGGWSPNVRVLYVVRTLCERHQPFPLSLTGDGVCGDGGGVCGDGGGVGGDGSGGVGGDGSGVGDGSGGGAGPPMPVCDPFCIPLSELDVPFGDPMPVGGGGGVVADGSGGAGPPMPVCDPFCIPLSKLDVPFGDPMLGQSSAPG